VTIPDTGGTLHTFQIALPQFVSRHTLSRSYTIVSANTDDTLTTEAHISEDITAIAQKTLEDRLGLIYLKAGGRALAKFLAAEKAKKDIKEGSDSKTKNVLASIAIDLLVGATEQADVRTWRTLPAEIQIGHLSLDPGQYTVSVVSSDGGYNLRSVAVEVKPGKSVFVLADDLR
jgi:hypothetical protein